jgi:hypothetical protein
MNKICTIKICILIFSITAVISGCKSGRSDRKYQRSASKEEVKGAKVQLKESVAELKKIVFFIENSGSMLGYVSQANEFKNSLVSLAYLPEFDKADKSFYFINGTSNLNKKSRIYTEYEGNDPEILKNNLNQKAFSVGDPKFSDLNKMFEIALDSAKEDQISVLISDCIYDVGEDTDPLTALRIEIKKTQQAFRNRLDQENVQTLVIKAYSKFNGPYYYASKKGFENIQDKDRPYYIIFFGNTELLNKLLTEQNIADKIDSHFEMARYLIFDKKDIPYKIIPSVNRKGDFRPDFNDSHKLTDARLLKGEFQFSFAADFTSLAYLSDNYLTSEENYSCSDPKFDVVKVEKITQKIPGADGTHLITVYTKKNPLGPLEIVLKNVTPGWVIETDTDNENSIDTSHTYGLKFLNDAISEAYTYKNKGTNIATFGIVISN